MKQLISLAGLAFALLLTACQDGFLNRFPNNAISEEQFFNSEEDLALYINGLISMRSAGDTYVGDEATDNAATTGAREVKTIMAGNASSQNITTGWDWSRLRDVNFFLANYQRAEASDEAKNHYAGIARFYRAEFYYAKVKRFSDVPWYGEVLSPDDEELYQAQDPRAMVVDSIMADLAFAAENIREDVPTGMIDRWSALALQARIALHEGTYRRYHPELGLESTADAFLQVAVQAAEALMASGRFSLYSTGDVMSDYAALFTSLDLTGNPEAILVNIYDAGKGREVGFLRLFDYEQSPSKDLLQSYLMQDGSRYTDQDDYQTRTFVEEFENRDPRLAQTYAAPGYVDVVNGGTEPYIQRLNTNFTGYHQIKGRLNTTDEVSRNSLDVPIYRYAEALLDLAEAKAELGSLTQADLDETVNALRARVGMPALDLNAANANVDPLLSAKYPNVSGANAGAIYEIRRERRVELALEGYRMDDLMRWGAGKVLEQAPEGLYFPGLGQYDLTGDGVEDIILIGAGEVIPTEEDKETNALGTKLIYYQTGSLAQDATVYLANGTEGNIVTSDATRTFTEPRDYYRPIPVYEVTLNPNLYQVFGWE
jgi:starch-binding outer membrane protein, SusD/RagB family